MAGLEGTQANARAAMEAAASLASEFGTKAVELRKAELASKVANEKLNVVKKAADQGMIDQESEAEHANKALDAMNEKADDSVTPEEVEKIAKTSDDKKVDVEVDKRRTRVNVTSNRETPRKPKQQTLKRDVQIFFRSYDNQVVTGRWHAVFNAGGQSFIEGGRDITQLEPAALYHDIPFQSLAHNFVTVLSDGFGGGDVAEGEDGFFHHVTIPLDLSVDGPIVIVVKQIRATFVRTTTESKSDTELKELVYGGELGYTSPAILRLFGGTVHGTFKISRRTNRSETEGEAESITHTVSYAARGLKYRQRDAEDLSIDPDL
jgi:hypothetical protein